MNAEQIARYHLDLHQRAIERFAANSARAKTWCVTLTTGLMFWAASQEQIDSTAVLVALVPAVVFGWLDAWYLAMERAARECYEKAAKAVRAGRAIENPLVVRLRRESVFAAARSPSVWPVYVALVGIVLAIYWYAS